jgi:hypothetical protein
MLSGGSAYLTRKRGPKWVKELDYVYLGLGAVGLFASLSKVEGVTGGCKKWDVLGPLIWATALVVRLLKTRAEIEGWAKPVGE